jgi:imidazolonepropionase
MLPFHSKENLADYIDVFCEQNFLPEENDRIVNAGQSWGLKAKRSTLTVAGIRWRALRQEWSFHAVSRGSHGSMDDDLSIRSTCRFIHNRNPVQRQRFFVRMNYQAGPALIDVGCAIALARIITPAQSPSVI